MKQLYILLGYLSTTVSPIMQIITRIEAQDRGAIHYFTGNPCIHGHTDVRMVKSGRCRMCCNIARKEYYSNNKQQALASIKQWSQQNKQKTAQIRQRWLDNSSPLKLKQIWNTYYKNNKSVVLIKSKQWRSANKDVVQQYNVKRRVLLGQAMPLWANVDEIKKVYSISTQLTAQTGIPHQVDHIIPLNHPLVCGLHVHNNLQVLTHSQNSRKHNSFSIS